MFAATADVFAPGDAQRVVSTTTQQQPPFMNLLVRPPNWVLGLAGLLVVVLVVHHLNKSKGGRRR